MYLAVSAETQGRDDNSRVPRLVKVCSATHIEHLIKQALPGIQLQHLPSPPQALSVKLKYQYFSLNQSGGAWEAVTRARNLAAYVPDDFPNPKLELLILLPQTVGTLRTAISSPHKETRKRRKSVTGFLVKIC